MEAAVTFLLETLRDEAVSIGKKLREASEKIVNLREEIVSFKANLEMWTKQPTDDARLKALVRRYREAVYEAEDIVDDYVVEKAKYQSKSWPQKLFSSFDYHGKLFGVAEKIRKIIDDANTMGENWNKVQASRGGEPSNRAPFNFPMVDMEVERNVVGFEDEQEKVINLLTGGSDKLEVISIVGMPGLGKTTLANMVFHNPKLRNKFQEHIWVYVSKDYIIKEVFLTILSHFIEVDNDIRGKSIDILVQKVRDYLNEVTYLIVMDDVWEPKDWDLNLKTAFPDNNRKSRILLTSRSRPVAKHANLEKEPVTLEVLNDEKSWELLKRKTFGSKECPDDLIEHGKNIAKQCGGLPLAIVVLGGILLEKGTDSSGWEAVSKDVGRYISGNRFIDLSFYQLRYPVKACFVYFGMFPKGSEIPMKKLISLWIAEGFIQKEGKSSLEDIAKEYLDELVNKSLVMTKSRNGKIKTCYVHDVMHEFCKEKAAEENLYHEVENTSNGPYSEEYHRICIHSSVLQYIISEKMGGRVRSFLCSSPGDITLESTHIIYPLRKYKLLRVFDGTPIIFPYFPSDLAQLFHLRYLVLHMRDKTLPESISHLWNLQSLIIHSSFRTLEIQGDTRKMAQLRQLKTNASTSWNALSKTDKKKVVSSRYSYEHLRKLSMVSIETCTQDAFDRVPNLYKLGIRGQLSKLFEVERGHSLFDSVVQLNSLEQLKLFNDPSHPESRTIDLPRKFPGKLKKLTLIGIQLDPENVSRLEMLENLEMLKLKDIEFKEMKWVMKKGFLNLKVLQIEKADFRFWEASDAQFPKLRHLSLIGCTRLSKIPLRLASISSLESMELERITALAARSAEEIEKQKADGGMPFKLSIISPA